MRKLTILLAILTCINGAVFASENTVAMPEQNFDDNRAVVSIQKQPSTENMQKQGVKNNWFCIVVQVNGKIDGIKNNAEEPAK